MSYGARVKRFREMRKMTQDELARRAEVPSTSISRIEHNDRKVTLEEAIRLAEILGVSLADLAGVPDLAPRSAEVITMAHHCAQKVHEAASALKDATTMADDLERTLAAH